MKIITISREFGYGGRELGKRLADALGVPCYDREIIKLIAEQNGFDEAYVSHLSEKVIQVSYPMTIGRRFVTTNPVLEQQIKIISSQREILRQFAQKGDCVIVG
ncbi:MAG: cytidylate kinase-like family protein, partial [Clostridia bacterium]|nr:cytidylate kinase-like family protein [Clostridia bacterium]